ncbi:hypothetical protein HGQ17_08205 [Nesterenkonia sp. MY13]|uniref:WXG100 family type VII secretion target n=1 Tax=Nesterenkonia sedimenti TaxID=1463632 RepID=A0A7X8TK05_9MICC|nr:hypothetical protein [Nesterenkonia sedimenti]NLS09979.1 hypothetical protein [Nesterenkonia sedimenti]
MGTIRFDMEEDILERQMNRSSTESEELNRAIENFKAAAAPLEGKFNGSAKAAFNNFKVRTDEISTTLNNALVGICQSIEGQNTSFRSGVSDATDYHQSQMNTANWDGADSAAFGPANIGR